MEDITQESVAEDSAADIFLSYSREDRDQVLPLIRALEAAGYTIWWDGLLEAGTVFLKTTEQALEEARAVLVVWTETSIDSHWVRDEATTERDNGTLVPVTLDGAIPPLGFRQFQVIDLSNWKNRQDFPEFRKILDKVASLTEKPTTPAQTKAGLTKPHFLGRRNLLIGGSIAAVTAGGVFVWQRDFTGAQVGSRDNSIAVLPLENLSGDPEQDYFSDGLSEELRTTLSGNSLLQVLAEVSSNSFKGQNEDAREIACQLGVSYLLDGSVRRSGNVVRITAQLINGETGFETWSDSFDRNMDDIFAVQTEIAETVVDALSLKLAAGENNRPGATSNSVAYDAYLRGRALYELAADEDTDRAALAQFEAAIAADPDYAAAFAARARVQTAIANISDDPAQVRKQYDNAVASAEKAVVLAPDLAEAHTALGFVLMNGQLDIRGAYQPYVKSFETGSGRAAILQGYASYMSRIGQFADAQKAIEKAVTLDPLNPSTFRTKGSVAYYAGQYDSAISSFNKALSLNPEMRAVNGFLGDVEYLRKNHEAAEQFYANEPSRFSRLVGQAINFKKLDKETEAEKVRAEFADAYGKNGLYQQAQISAQWGELDTALNFLEQANAIGDAGLVLARNDPFLVPLREEPRFQAILSGLGFTQP